MKSIKCPGCARERPVSEYLVRAGQEARKRNREGQPFGRCADCRRMGKSSPRQFIMSLIVKAKQRREYPAIKGITIDHMMHLLRMQGGLCPITGLQLTFSRGSGVVFTNASIDRIDPTKGYIQGNVRLVTLWANLARNAMSDEDLVYFCHLVATRHQQRSRKQ